MAQYKEFGSVHTTILIRYKKIKKIDTSNQTNKKNLEFSNA